MAVNMCYATGSFNILLTLGETLGLNTLGKTTMCGDWHGYIKTELVSNYHKLYILI